MEEQGVNGQFAKQIAPVRISYSLLTLFRNCRKAAYYRYVKGLKPLQKSSALNFGTIIHSGLEHWHTHKDIKAAVKHIEPQFILIDDFLAGASMLEAYAQKYRVDDLEPVIVDGKSGIEVDFDYPILDTDTLEFIPGVSMVGKIDGIVKRDNEYFLLEHKTAYKLDGNYIDKLWSDFQITLYCYYVNKFFKLPCSGVMYNILVKPDFKRKKGESLEEFTERYNEAARTNKSGKTNVKRKLPESDSDYVTRLAEFYQEPASIHREVIYIGKKQMKHVISEVSELTKAFMACMQRDRFYMNTDNCFKYNSPCPYFAICKSGGSEHIINNCYEYSPRVTLDVLENYEGPVL